MNLGQTIFSVYKMWLCVPIQNIYVYKLQFQNSIMEKKYKCKIKGCVIHAVLEDLQENQQYRCGSNLQRVAA